MSNWLNEEAANNYEEETFDNIDNLPQYEQDITGLREGAEQQPSTERATGESATGQEGTGVTEVTPGTDRNAPSGWSPINEDEEAPFSRGMAGRSITMAQAIKINRVLQRVFKGLKILIPSTKEFNQRLKEAVKENRIITAKAVLDEANKAFNKAQRKLNSTVTKLDGISSVQTTIDQPVTQANIGISKEERESILKPLREEFARTKAELEAAKKEFAAASQEDPNQMMLFSKDGSRVLGFVDVAGDVILNPDELTIDTALHEVGGHILSKWAKANHPELYKKIQEIAREIPQEFADKALEGYNFPEKNDSYYE